MGCFVLRECKKVSGIQGFSCKFISDQAVVHLMAFNPVEHQKIVSSRETEEEDDSRNENVIFWEKK